MSSICQGVVASAENKDSTCFEVVDLGTHANMVALGRNCHVVNYSSKTAEVNPFITDCKALKVLIVDAAIQHEGPYQRETCMLV